MDVSVWERVHGRPCCSCPCLNRTVALVLYDVADILLSWAKVELAIYSQTTAESAAVAPNQGLVIVSMYSPYCCGPYSCPAI